MHKSYKDKLYTGGSCLSQIFGSMKICLAYLIIITNLIIQGNLAKKIQAKQESGLTAVWLKGDPPVQMLVKIKEILTEMYFHMPCQTFNANLCYLHHNMQVGPA